MNRCIPVAGVYVFLSKHSSSLSSPTTPINGDVHVYSTNINDVLVSSTEAEIGALFLNTKQTIAIHTNLDDLSHPHYPTPIQTYNKCTVGIVNDTVKQKRSKAVYMRLYWIIYCVRQVHILVHWRPGSANIGEYFTKHFKSSHHRKVHPILFVPTSAKREKPIPDIFTIAPSFQ